MKSPICQLMIQYKLIIFYVDSTDALINFTTSANSLLEKCWLKSTYR